MCTCACMHVLTIFLHVVCSFPFAVFHSPHRTTPHTHISVSVYLQYRLDRRLSSTSPPCPVPLPNLLHLSPPLPTTHLYPVIPYIIPTRIQNDRPNPNPSPITYHTCNKPTTHNGRLTSHHRPGIHEWTQSSQVFLCQVQDPRPSTRKRPSICNRRISIGDISGRNSPQGPVRRSIN